MNETDYLTWSNNWNTSNYGNIDLAHIRDRFRRNNLSKKGGMLLQTDLRLIPSIQSAVVVQSEPPGGDPVRE